MTRPASEACAARYPVWTTVSVPEDSVRRLADALDVPATVAAILVGRGQADPEQAKSFLDPRLQAVSDPFLLPGMDRAVARLTNALRNKERIAIFGDYDVDGIAAATLLASTLRQLGGCATPFLPNRGREGYGFTPAALARCLAHCRPTLIVTADCGTGANETVALARAADCDVIVTDHHAPAPPVPGAVADLNPKRTDHADLHGLAGVGVAFKLCHGLVKHGLRTGFPISSNFDLRDALDLVALGSVADMVPLTGENRTWVRHGLACLDRTRRIGLQALVETAKLSLPLSPSDIGFGLGPRLNAAGRLGSADDALALLMTDEPAEARRLARALEAANRQRRETELRIRNEALALLERETTDLATRFGIAIANDNWEPGVIGIVASRVCRLHNRPAAIVSFLDGDSGRGSCRSIEGVDILDALRQCQSLLKAFGGHSMAAGFSIARNDWPAFCQAFNEACRDQLNGRPPVPAIAIDAWLDSLEDAGDHLYRHIGRLAPFGQDNPLPVLGFRNLTLDAPARILAGRHLKFRVRQNASVMDAIAFDAGNRALPDGPFELAARLTENNYRGRTTLQLVVQDFRTA